MRYIDATVEEFSKYIKYKNKKIVLFGSGAVCKTFVPYIANKYNFSINILYIIDNNPSKQNSFVDINGNLVKVVSIDILKKINCDYCILITNGEFYSVIRQLDRIEDCYEKDCFIAAYMQLGRTYDKEKNSIYKDYNNPQIPRIIHYCWFSGQPIPDELEKCINDWKGKCPEYEIIRWDESNFDVKKYRYTYEAYKLKKWGYIPDIVRLEKLYELGGFYFDTDVEIVKNLDTMRYQMAFCGRERGGHVNFGGGSGSVKGNPVIKEILEFRQNEAFDLGNGRFNSEASGYYETRPLMNRGLKIEDINQKIDGINIYASEFFSPYNYVNGENIYNKNTFSVHYFSGSWIDSGKMLRKETRKKYYQFKNKLERIII